MIIRVLKALQDEFGEQFHLLANAQYFTSQQVREFIENSVLKVTYLSNGSPDMNPVEECWRQFIQRLGIRFFETLDELRPPVWTALDAITPLQIIAYLCP